MHLELSQNLKTAISHSQILENTLQISQDVIDGPHSLYVFDIFCQLQTFLQRKASNLPKLTSKVPISNTVSLSTMGKNQDYSQNSLFELHWQLAPEAFLQTISKMDFFCIRRYLLFATIYLISFHFEMCFAFLTETNE